MKKSITALLVSMALPTSVFASDVDSPSTRIINGVEAGKNDWPFMVALIKKGQDAFNGQICGGSFIGDRYILTAAHCIDGKNAAEFDVSIGIHDLTNEASEGQRVALQTIYAHEQYDASTTVNDIAILELADAVNATSVTLATQAELNAINAGDLVTVMGWGNQEDDSYSQPIYPETLYEVDLEYVDRGVCQALGGNYSNVSDDAICAGFSYGGKDSCQGDSGGPLVYDDNGITKQIGVVSWGDGCAQADAYGVYANVGYFSNNGWIADKTSGVSYTQNDYLGYVSTGTHTVTLPIRNYSSEAFNVLTVTASNGSSITDNTCTSSLAQNESCEITVQYTASLAYESTEVSYTTDHSSVSSFSTTLYYQGLNAASSDLASLVGVGQEVLVSENPWVVNGSSVQAASISHSESSVLHIAGLGEGSLSFDMQVSSEQNFDIAYVYVNGVATEQVSGQDSDYVSYTVDLGLETNSVTYVYQKDSSDSANDDTVYVKNFKTSSERSTGSSSGSGGSVSLFMLGLVGLFGTYRRKRLS
ncbi:S1 family peptidase [Vibrio paucivorans]